MLIMRYAAGAVLPIVFLVAACNGASDESRNAALASLDSRLTGANTENAAEANDGTRNSADNQAGARFDTGADTAAVGEGTIGTRLRDVAAEGSAGVAASVGKGCADALRYDDSWVERMPRAFRPYNAARLQEAAGVVTDRCTLIGLTLTTPDSPEALLAHYAAAARAAGYDAERADAQGDLRLGGTRGADGPAYVILARPHGKGGAEADILYVE